MKRRSIMKLDKKLWYTLDWKTLRKNKDENMGNPENDFDGFINTKEGEVCIIEYTNVYTFSNQNDIALWERSKIEKSEKNIGEFLSKINWNMDRNEIMEGIKFSHK
ncbi:MAG: hypothetical protein KAG14_04840, partial [Mycoplasmataceae bacterium]|nr:hypothetical protein [Mycoplasmataceae bacterium]